MGRNIKWARLSDITKKHVKRHFIGVIEVISRLVYIYYPLNWHAMSIRETISGIFS